jgi:hypothetical protein
MCAVVFTLFAIFASGAAAPALAVSALPPIAPAMRHLATACAGSTLNHTDSDTTSTDLSAADCAAWQEGYDELGAGARWIKCGDERTDPCGCSGVVCVGGNITSVWLNENNMAGSLPSAFSKLTQLTTLFLHGNHLTDVLPTAWSALTLLTHLDLSNQRSSSKLTGGLPSEWKTLAHIKRLLLNGNALAGEIPSEWGALTEITHLYLQVNKLTGKLPAALANLTKMTHLYLGTNLLTGDCPAVWAAMTQMHTLNLNGNELTGELPKAWATMTQTINLLLNGNRLVGEIPKEWKSLTQIKRLFLDDNMLTGELPKALAALTQITHLQLNNNNLHGAVPTDLVPVFERLTTCTLAANRFRCDLPAGLPSTCGATCCPAGKFNIPPATACLPCPGATNGTSSVGADCFVCSCGGEPCAKGTYGMWDAATNHTCTTCSRGRFQDVFGAEGVNSCKSCLVATVESPDADPGSDSMSDCVALLSGRFCDTGQSAVGTNLGHCEPCAAGRFKQGNNTKACESCPCGQWQSLPGQGGCGAACVDGTFGNAATGQCEPCPPDGFFCVENQKVHLSKATRCIPGERELFAPNATADRVCAPCAPGTFSNVINAADCGRCPSGKYQDLGGQPFCIACGVGQFKAAADRCEPCAAGAFQNATGQAQCTECSSIACPNGAHRKGCGGTSAGYCGTCSPGRYIDGSVCSACAAGRFSDEENAATCEQCPDAFQPATGKGFCLPHTVCAKGEHVVSMPSATTDRTCQACRAMHFSDESNAVTCERCPAGKFQDAVGQPYCEAKQPCAPGTFEANALDQSSGRCQPCPAMHFSNASNAVSCERCPAGKFQKLQGQPYCEAKQPCAPGSFEANATDVSGTRCHRCPKMHFSNTSNAASCERCPGGKFQDKLGQPFCETCSEGSVCLVNNATGIVQKQQCPAGFRCSSDSVEPERCVNKISNSATGKCISCEDKQFANTRTNTCMACPKLHEDSETLLAPGVECSGGSIGFKDDIFVVPDGRAIGPHTTTLRCRDPGACTTSVDLTNFTALTVCQGSTTGALCGACEDGYAKGAPGSPCVQCAADGGAAPVLLLLAALLLFGFLYRQCIKFALQNARKGHKSKFMTFSLLKIGMAYVRLCVRAAIAARWCLSNPLCSSRSPTPTPTPTLTPTPGSSSRRRCSRASTSTGAPSWASSSESTPSRAAATRPHWRRPSASASTCTRRRR